MQTHQPIKQYPPRRFPQQQYQRLGHHFWAIIIGIIVIVLIGGGIIVKASLNSPHVTHRPVRSVKVCHHHGQRTKHSDQPLVNVSPRHGERLLGHWLIKLRYSQGQTQSVLKNYEKTNQIKEHQLTKRLINYTHNQDATKVQQLIKHNLK